jgi:SAM-dependent methyltransferase
MTDFASDEAAETHEIVAIVDGSGDDERVRMCVEYFDREASTYDSFDSQVTRRRKYCAAVDDFVVERLGEVEGLRTVLSLGCGTGRREAAIADRLKPRPSLVGIEPAPAMATQASQKGLRVYPTLEAGIPAVEAAICLSAFVHLPSSSARSDALFRLSDLMVDDGVLIVDVFNVDDRHEWGPQLNRQMVGSDRWRGDVLYRRVGRPEVSYMHYFSVGEMTSLVEQADFLVESIVGVGYMHRSGQIGVPFDEGCLLLTCRRRPR